MHQINIFHLRYRPMFYEQLKRKKKKKQIIIIISHNIRIYWWNIEIICTSFKNSPMTIFPTSERKV